MSKLEILGTIFVIAELFAIAWRVRIDSDSIKIQRYLMEDRIASHKLISANANRQACSSIINDMIYEMEVAKTDRSINFDQVLSNLKQALAYLNRY